MPYNYISRVGEPFQQWQGDHFKPYFLPRNLMRGVPYFGFVPQYNLDLSKEEVFAYLGLWENRNGIGLVGRAWNIRTGSIIFKTHTDGGAVVQRADDLILVGDIITYGGLIYNVIEAVGVLNDDDSFFVNLVLQITPLIAKIYEPFFFQDLVLTTQKSIADATIAVFDGLKPLISDYVKDMVDAKISGALAGPYPVTTAAGDLLLPPIKENFESGYSGELAPLESETETGYNLLEDNKLWQ